MFWRRRERFSRPELSLLIPWADGDPVRARSFEWLRRYWRENLPEAEIVIGRSRGKPFAKTQAFNDAARRANGRVFALLDADALLRPDTLRRATVRILADLGSPEPLNLWLIPYRRLFRLSRAASDEILESSPAGPDWPPDPTPAWMLEDDPSRSGYGRRYGAMAMVIPRRAWEVLGGFDERFRGWGGEDAAMLRALDTLYGKHKSLDAPVWHLWHAKIGGTYRERRWTGQKGEHPNDRLASAYHRATRNREAMRALIDAGRPSPQTRLGRIIAALRRLR